MQDQDDRETRRAFAGADQLATVRSYNVTWKVRGKIVARYSYKVKAENAHATRWTCTAHLNRDARTWATYLARL